MPNDGNSDGNEVNLHNEAKTLASLITALQDLAPETRNRLINTVVTFFDVTLNETTQDKATSPGYSVLKESPRFSEDRTMSPKEFLLEKQPRTDVERVTCLAYYLSHYRDTPHFKTIDISKLNTEAAQRKFVNAAKAVDNATRSEYLVTAVKGQKQIGAIGEVFVDGLPDREAAKSAVNKLRPRKRRVVKKKV